MASIVPPDVIRRRLPAILAAAVLFLTSLVGFKPAARPNVERSSKAARAPRQLPVRFEPNLGQFTPGVSFVARTARYSALISPSETVFVLPRPQDPGRNVRVRMTVTGGNAAARTAGERPLPGRSSYFIGNDPGRWRTRVPQYGAVRIEAVLPEIDLRYHADRGQLEFDFVLAPGAEPESIGLAFEMDGVSTDHLSITAGGGGSLTLGCMGTELRLEPPRVYQEIEGTRKEIAGAYVVREDGLVSFELAPFDRSRPVVIDPVLVYCTYLGGSTSEYAASIAVDPEGNAYLAGTTYSYNFARESPSRREPTRDPNFPDAFVAKLDDTGTLLLYSIYLGGGRRDSASGIAVDALGNAYITGTTASADFPLRHAIQSDPPDFFADNLRSGSERRGAFVCSIDPTGSSLRYSTFLGSRSTGVAISVDSTGSAYVAGAYHGGTFPLIDPNDFRRNICGTSPSTSCSDFFVSKFEPSGQALSYSMTLGGSYLDWPSGVSVDPSGAAYVAGGTSSQDFPLLTNIGEIVRGWGFLTKISSAGDGAIYSTYVGGRSSQNIGGVAGIAVDAAGSAYLTGSTIGPDLPVRNAFQSTAGGDCDAFVMKISPIGNEIVYCSYLGGSGADYGESIGLDAAGNAYVAGMTWSTDFPLVSPIRQVIEESDKPNSFLAKITPDGSRLLFSTYIPGATKNWSTVALAAMPAGDVFIAGDTSGTNLAVTPGAVQTRNRGHRNAFVARIDSSPSPELAIGMSQAAYSEGETITASGLKLSNPGPVRLAHVRMWLSVPGVGDVDLIDFGSDFTFYVPAAIDQELGPVSLIQVTGETPKGNWELNSRLTTPARETVLSEDINRFVVR